MSTSLADDRAELRRLLCADGIFRSTDEHPILARDGTRISWMLDTLRLSMTTRGAELSARCLLDLLGRFDGCQIATYGLTAIPLLQACVTLSGGRYHGLVVRKELKGYGSQKLIEGRVDRDEPVIVIDDSVSSGSSMTACVDKLEAAGLRVEGGACLVRFGWHGGYARMQERGLHMEHVFDVFEDLVPHVEPSRPRHPYNPSDLMPAFAWADQVADDGVHPARFAREVMERFARGEPVPRPPRRFDRDYDGRGGCWVSVRSRANIHLRHARDGLWVFPRDDRRELGENLVRAAVRTAARIMEPGALASSAVAVTFFGELEECTVGELDNDRYGIVVRSAERVERLGGALPRMPGMSREWAQFEHARSKNGRLYRFEPFVLFRHTVDKAVEPGEPWQPTGTPKDHTPTWHQDPARAGRVAARAHDLACAMITGRAPHTEPLADDTIGAVDAIFVSIYRHGRVAGCIGGTMRRLDDDLRRITEQALADRRFKTSAGPVDVDEPALPVGTGRRPLGIDELVVTVSFLDDATPMGVQSPADIAVRARHGEQALTVFQNARNALLLPFVVLQQGLSPQQYVTELVDKAGITRAPYHWGRYDVTTWLADRDPPRRLVWGLPPGPPPATMAAALETLTPLMVGYLLRHTRADGLRDGYYRPFLDQVVGELELPRQIHGVWTLARAHRVLGGDALGDAARRGLDAVTAKVSAPTLRDAAFLLLAEVELEATGPGARDHAARLWGAIDRHGGFAVDRDVEHDYLPPQVLLALAGAARRGVAEPEHAALERARRMCRHRFRTRRGWGQVSWLPQAAAAWWAVTGDRVWAELAFEVIDWALGYQQETSGGFINGEQPDAPGYSTGVYLEGVAAALSLAVAVADHGRADRYRTAATAALRFLDVIVYQERDRPLLPAPERAYGGVRCSRTAGDVRIDFVQHALNALLLLR